MGYSVEVFEASNNPGGKIKEQLLGRYRFDMGPSVLTQPHLVEELFSLAKENPANYFTFKKPEHIFRYFFEDGTELNTFNESGKTIAELVSKLEISGDLINRYLNQSEEIYKITAPVFLERSLHQAKNYWNKETLHGMLNFGKIKAFQSLNKYNCESLRHPKLVQIFNQYASYNGSNPYKAPGTLSVIAHFEQNGGVFIPKDGIYSIVDSLYKLALRLGVKFQFGQRVEEILTENNKVTGIRTKHEIFKSSIIVSNADAFNTWKHLLSKHPIPKNIKTHERSSSMVVFYWGVKKKFPELCLHNMFMSENSEEEYRCIFEKKVLHPDPSVYVNITAKELPEDAPEGCENWFVMVSVPPIAGQDWDKLVEDCRRNILNKISKRLKTNIEELIDVEDCLEPRMIESRYNSALGSVYGFSSNSVWSAFMRQSNFSRTIKGLYFCGGSVHPGAGMPLCLLSAKITSGLIQERQ